MPSDEVERQAVKPGDGDEQSAALFEAAYPASPQVLDNKDSTAFPGKAGSDGAGRLKRQEVYGTFGSVTVRDRSDYPGEAIYRDLPPLICAAGKADTLQGIAKERLGHDAGSAEILAYMKEIVQVNQLGSPPQIKDGMPLNLPGHTKDGGFVVLDNAGNKSTRWVDGSWRLDRSDDSWVLHRASKGGGFREEQGGNERPEGNFVLVKTNDGRFQLADSIDRSAIERNTLFDSPLGQVESSGHMALAELAESKIKDPERLAKFRADMLRFEERMTVRDLAVMETDATYRQVERLLQAEGDKPLSAEQRLQLAEEVMSQLATPTAIDQGNHNTCNVTVVETRTYTKFPETAAQLVADAALTGRYEAQDGTLVQLSAESLQPDVEGQAHPPKYGQRSYASQLFQVTAANVHWAKDNAMWNPPGQLRYEQHAPTPNLTPPDTGERLVDHSKNPPKTIVTAPQLHDSNIAEISSAITGESKFEDLFLVHRQKELGSHSGLTIIGSEEELDKKLAQVAGDGKLPVIISVDSHFEPFWTDSSSGAAGGANGAHVVTITGYDAGPPARVSIDNQWGDQADHSGRDTPTVHDIYLAMRPPELSSAIADLRRDVELNRRNHKVDAIKELELLRLENDRKPIPNQAYDDAIVQQMADAQRRWQQQATNGSVDLAEEKRTRQCFRHMLARLSVDRQEAIVSRLCAQAPEDEDLQVQLAEIQERKGKGAMPSATMQ